MDYLKVLKDLVIEGDGLVLSKDLQDAGISRQLLAKYVKKGYLMRIGHGIYMTKEYFEDEMYVLQARSDKAVFSHETALYIHDLTDRDPLNYTITLPSGYNAARFKKEGINVFYIKKELLELGVEEGQTVFGRTIKVYNRERTICDIVRNRFSIDAFILNESIRKYTSSRDKNIPLLLKYAKELRVEKVVRNYLEVLL